jgi:hypothetical protein
MTLIGEVQKARRHAQTLQNIESLQSFSLHNTVVQIVVDDELRCASIDKMRKRVPEFVVLAVIPDSTVVVALDEPEFVGSVGTDLVDLSVVTDKRFELTT